MDFMEHLRKIIHVDMDAFYASVEQLDDPSLSGKALAVGGSSKRGVVAAASYEARKFGVKSAMSGRLAARLCPHLIFVKPRFERYKEISQIIRKVFFEYTDLVEPLSLDEAYLDVTVNKFDYPSATILAREIRKKIKDRTGLNASAGISINKFIAKIASDINKPNGQKTIPPEDVISFLETLDIRKFHGVGKVTQEKMYGLGIFTGVDLKLKTLEYLQDRFGKSGLHYYNVVRGVHLSEVKPTRIRKSLGAERTFSENISSEIYMLEKLEDIAEEVERRLKGSRVAGKTITLKLKTSDFNIQTRSKTLKFFISSKALIMEETKALLFQEPIKDSIRLLGISLSNLNTDKTPKVTPKLKEEQLKLPF
ncbi:DNA polymerase IV [Psychroflexus gondwanensis]|jgi:DNA polymerase-4|uniref:DNA polymerase IV n=1 Tax=Psychroflexus gondwanensis TaxID=251 RepID=UPI0011BF4DA0|nr:DNA polymerase IV [Psychroflexus gondwanensis]TXE18445.1 DNA polymerase IV [Psychroflexus gondwanensis]